MARKSQFRIDLHVHSKYSGESLAEPKEIIECALEKGLDGICITEHGSLYVSRPFEELKNKYPLLIFRGVELATDAGHMLVYGVDDEAWDDWGKDRICNAQELIDRVAKLGGIAIPAHPWHISRGAGDQNGLIVSVDDRVANLKNLTAIEVCNGKQAGNPIVHEILGTFAREQSLGAIGGSDAHTPENVGRAFTIFRAPIYTPQHLVNALMSKRYYPQIG
ncbi:MAG TPA: PHP domain-containing protein [Bacillota bacterium]|jgi:predicted metal-dependent phosphoesterase TrpH|nr:PHP domain-containing protein [Candidatus Fermentithermobacillaceae bacterium]HOB30883.1 PHP domain-containing protein [Bacillota bacterium]HOK64680.1 PHP domain-containing protein [Bacillota bacterium]HOL12189.1 PHP domain-containing protein [Bacillota bacterium]HOQ02227.1 PHP domain-containing protein [Bacillota bacterium]